MSQLRILYSSNAMWASSGYGVQGASLLPRLADLPEVAGRENIAQFAWYGLAGGIHQVNGFRIYPQGMDAYGNDIIESHTKHFGANLVITLIDNWVLKDIAKKVSPALWVPWLPIDHQPVPEQILTSLQGAHLPLTYSKWGHDELAKAGIPNEYIPHGLEPAVFKINPDLEAVKQFKQQLAPGCTHLTAMVAANKGYPDRKAFQVQLRAWANFAKDKPGARLYLHTEPTTMYGGLDLGALLNHLGIADRAFFPQRYDYFCGFSAEYMAMMYNAADVLLAASMAEGFGIPLIEAQACGCPVITTHFTAMPELVRWGVAVPPADLYWTPLNAWQAWPDVRGIHQVLEEMYAQWEIAKGWPMSARFRASEAIHSEYGWDAIVRDNWGPLIAKLAGEVPGQSVQIISKEMVPA